MSIGLIRLLRRQNWLQQDDEAHYLQLLQTQNHILPDLFAHHICTPDSLLALLHQHFAYPLYSEDHFIDLPNHFFGLTTEAMQTHRCVPLYQRGHSIFLAVSDPFRAQEWEALFFPQGLRAEPVLLADDRLSLWLETLCQPKAMSLPDLPSDWQMDEMQAALDDKNDDGPIAQFAEKILLYAVAQNASDIHIEFYEKEARLRLRIDGKLQTRIQLPLNLRHRLSSRLKIMANLDIAEKRLPQDGRIRLQKNQQNIDFRISTLPCLFGEKLVLRILKNEQQFLDLAHLGLEPQQLNHLHYALSKPQGMILATGATGSGKTVTLYACLHHINHDHINICTAEDPAEITLKGVNQVSINEKQGLDFANALRSFLRQDPDVIMVGEIRDSETADIALKAAQTGHLVFSTLHTNHSCATLSRLINMGIAPFNIAASVSLIVAQRLVRKLCPHCKTPMPKLPEQTLIQSGFQADDLRQKWRLFQAQGCAHCQFTGYHGRIGVYEVLPISEKMKTAILNGGNEYTLQSIMQEEQHLDLKRAALLKVMRGETSLAEALQL